MRKLVTLSVVIMLSQSILAQDSVDVTFYYYPDNNPASVHIPGEFNGWNSSGDISRMTYDALDHSWSRTVRLRVGGPDPLPATNSVPGAYQYKFYDGNWFSDPLNPHLNTLDNNNTYISVNDPTIHLLLPNSTPASETVRSRHPEISAYVFPSTTTSIDTASIQLRVDSITYTGLGGSYDPITHQFSFSVPDDLANGNHSMTLSASNSAGSFNSESTTFEVQADLVQFFTLPAQTWKNTWRLQGAIFTVDGNYNQDVHRAELVRGAERWSVTVENGLIDTSLTLLDETNDFQIEVLIDGVSEASGMLTIQKKVAHRPVAKIQIIDVGSILIVSGGASQDPDGGSLSYNWYESGENPQSLGLSGSTDTQVNLTPPTQPGEYYVSLIVEDADGETDSTEAFFNIGPEGEVADVGGYASNPQWVKNSRIYLLFFKAFTTEGTIAAAIPNLDYIAAMGFNTIWVLPVMEIPGNVDNQINIGYYIEDFMKVEASYGTNQDYKDFVAAAHELGLRVIQDVTPNHTGKVHAFAEEANLYGDFSQYWYYYQTEYIPHNTNGLGDCFTSAGIHYYCNFSDALLSWDWRDLDARTYMIGVYEYWMKEFGIDGYRFDVYWGPNRKFGEINMGTPTREALKRIKPDILLLGEDDGTGSGTESIYADHGGGLDVAYDFKTYFNAIRSFGFSSTSVNTLHSELDNSGFYPGENAYYLRFMESQDEDRITYKYDSFEKTMPMASVILTAPGIPMITNGQEVGWGKGMGAAGEPDLNDRRRGIIDWEFAGRDLLTPHYQKLAQIRAQFPAFWQHRKDTNGDGNVDGSDESDFDRVATGNGIVYAFLRPFKESNGLTVVNFSDTEQSVQLSLAIENLKFSNAFHLDSTYWVNNLYQGLSEQLLGSDLQNYNVTLPAYGTAIFTISSREEMVDIPAIPALLAVDGDEKTVPDEFRLLQNFPNPFNPSTTFRFNLPIATSLSLRVYDIRGREVWSAAGGSTEYAAGTHEIVWNGFNQQHKALPTGIYFVELSTSGFRQVLKIMLIR